MSPCLLRPLKAYYSNDKMTVLCRLARTVVSFSLRIVLFTLSLLANDGLAWTGCIVCVVLMDAKAAPQILHSFRPSRCMGPCILPSVQTLH